MSLRQRPVSPIWVGGRPQHGEDEFLVTHPWNDAPVGATSWATQGQVETAIRAAHSIAPEFAATSAYDRAAALEYMRRRIEEEAETLAELISAESGKPILWSRIEVARAASTFRWAAEEVRRMSGEVQRLDTDASGLGRLAYTRRFPRGPVLGITPFNFPLNLVAHKVAPALAAGCPIVVKPAPSTPLAALQLASFFSETKLPHEAFSVLPASVELTKRMVADARLPLVSFTGSVPVGHEIQHAVPDKHVTLELGGNAAALVCADYSQLDWAVERIATFGNYQAGQSCISVQRVFVESPIFEEVKKKLVTAVKALRTGDPFDPTTQVGPLIDVRSAHRVHEWVQEAIAAGAECLIGGDEPAGAELAPTVLTHVPRETRVVGDEVFGPVLILEEVANLTEGLAAVNDSKFGLQAGVFTDNIATAMRAHRDLEVGGVIVGDVPSFRADQMPYGGMKNSGVGREGVRSAIEDYTSERVLVMPDVF
ncbi:aldehyde dehydrogenase family protein [Haloglycomyces albus]|uniref:aldehyde dehydrogenase family protein n=1 Tax=Haloglycomyces albus TaxID=526067 RepID=UPI00055570F2|nr:aldehyde dehydrogenase family protein [Haloglycomyces albus]